MGATLNIAWMTSRKDCKFEWFADSLLNQLGKDFINTRLIVVDYWSQTMPHLDWNDEAAVTRRDSFRQHLKSRIGPLAEFGLIITPPKPTPWQGPHRLTKNDYFAAANARNTAICHALDGYMVFCDDLSVLLPGWLAAVREHMAKNQIVCGAFRKVKNLKVENGNVVSFDDHPAGHDSRWNHGKDDQAVECWSNWLFGCSFGAPVERLLEVNGLCEDADSGGLGMEDCALGIAFANNGHKLVYARRMMTFESEEHHHLDKPMLRVDKKLGGVVTIRPGVTHPNEKGHFFVRNFQSAKRFGNYFGEEGIAGQRQKILNGDTFPTNVHPHHDWFDSQPLSEL